MVSTEPLIYLLNPIKALINLIKSKLLHQSPLLLNLATTDIESIEYCKFGSNAKVLKIQTQDRNFKLFLKSHELLLKKLNIKH